MTKVNRRTIHISTVLSVWICLYNFWPKTKANYVESERQFNIAPVCGERTAFEPSVEYCSTEWIAPHIRLTQTDSFDAHHSQWLAPQFGGIGFASLICWFTLSLSPGTHAHWQWRSVKFHVRHMRLKNKTSMLHSVMSIY